MPTERALHSDILKTSVHRASFPSSYDEIKVKWLIDEKPFWWPATVVAINDSMEKNTHVRRGEISYHAFMQYKRERATVNFSFEPKTLSKYLQNVPLGDRTTGTEADDESEVCSWVFWNESIPEDEENEVNLSSFMPGSSSATSKEPSPTRQTSSLSTSSNILALSGIGKNKATKRARRLSIGCPVTSPPNHPTLVSLRRKVNTGSNKLSTAVVSTIRSQGILRSDECSACSSKKDSFCTANDRANDTMGSAPSTHNSSELTQLKIRVELLESSLRDLLRSRTPAELPASSVTAILTLKWSLLNRMGKPLKPMKLDGLCTHGIATNHITVKSECDSKSFKDICAALAIRHQYHESPYSSTSNGSGTERIRFIPDFFRTQSDSLGSGTQEVLFTTLSDVADFLGIRDDEDYERLLTKEVITEKSNLVQVVGSLQIVSPVASSTTVSSDQRDGDINVSPSNSTSFLRVFVGTAPHEVVPLDDAPSGMKSKDGGRSESGGSLKSFVLEQKCSHFSIKKSCYRTNWTSCATKAPCKHPPPLDDGEEEKELDLTGCFSLKWTEIKAPSATKWTSDVQRSASVTPGQLSLTIPTVFASARLNALSISALLDRHIETYMTHRFKLRTILTTAPPETSSHFG